MKNALKDSETAQQPNPADLLRVERALTEDWQRASEIAKAAGTSRPSTYRALHFLDEQELVDHELGRRQAGEMVPSVKPLHYWRLPQ